MKKLPLILLAALLLLASCNNSDEPTLSSEEAKISIQSMSMDMNDDIIDLMNSDGVASISTFMDYSLASTEFGNLSLRTEEQKIRLLQLVTIFGTGPSARIATETPNVMPTGVYEWNRSEADFVFVEEANALILKFPVGESETNNGIFTLSDLSFDSNGLPTSVEATIKVDGESFMSLSLEANWSEDGLPEMLNLYLLIKPYYISVNFDNTGANTTLYASIEKLDQIIAAIDLKVNYSSPEKIFPNKIEGSVTYRDVKIAGTINVLAALQNENGNPNEFIDLKVFVKGEKIGKIVFILESDDESNDEHLDYVPYIKYNDGTLESLEDILEELLHGFEEGVANM
jgi:hypothetical protein